MRPNSATFDGNGNVIAYIDMATGAKSANYDYNAFGETIISDGPAAEAFSFKFSTRYTDQETGIVMFPLRPYSPSSGRFLCKDPIEEDGGANLYGFVGNDAINAIDPLGLVLVAVDGTDSFDWVYGRGANSHVLNFYKDWRGPGRKLYLDGPSTSGRGIDAAVEQGTKFICDAIKNNPGEPVFLIGHSRGGLIVAKISEKLNSEGCSCVKNASSVPVRFVGLYDAVDMSVNSGGDVPRNVRDVAHGRRDPSVGSRLLWGNTAQGGGRNYNEQFFKGTHSAMGGDPLHGDVGNPFGEGRESSASDAIDRFVRSNATSAGAQLAPKTP